MTGKQVVMRISPELLARIEHAAEILGLKRQAFLVMAAAEKTRQVEVLHGVPVNTETQKQ